jgi:hypothetical protein
MEQGTLWELDEKIDSAAHPAWGQFDPVVQTVRPHPDPQPGEKESDHE